MNMTYDEYTLRKCSTKDIPQILELQKEIFKSLDNKELLRENTAEMFMHCLEDDNLIIGVFNKLELVAIAILVFETGEENLASDLKKHCVQNSANMKLILVKEAYRGKGLQKSLMWIIEKYAYNHGTTHLCTTVHKQNKFSLNNILAMGYEFDQSTVKYGGLERDVYVKDIHKSVSLHNKNILNIINSIENKNEPNDLITEGINFQKCFLGELSIASTGDILEYEDIDSGNTYWGLFVINFSSMVLIFIPEKGCLQFVEYSDTISSLRLKKVWINTLGGF